MTDTKKTLRKGEWSSIDNIKDLLICPVCREENLIYYKSSKTRSHKSCSCGCKIYQTKDRLWFIIPENKLEKFTEDKDKFKKYMDMSKN